MYAQYMCTVPPKLLYTIEVNIDYRFSMIDEILIVWNRYGIHLGLVRDTFMKSLSLGLNHSKQGQFQSEDHSLQIIPEGPNEHFCARQLRPCLRTYKFTEGLIQPARKATIKYHKNLT